jgi:processive 1,2-diacylglycerol beta-glucosyltransferase
MKILYIIPQDKEGNEHISGVEYHRLEVPFSNLAYDTSFEIVKANDVKVDYLPDIVVCNRTVSKYGYKHNLEAIQYLKEKNIPYILDLDDYWILGENHRLNNYWQENNIAQQVLDSIHSAREVWVTNQYLRSKVLPHHQSIRIVPNAIDFSQPQFQTKPKTNDKCIIGWSGSNTHYMDIKTHENSFKKLHTDRLIQKDYQVLLAGYHHNDYWMNRIEMIMAAQGRATPYTYNRLPALNVFSYAQLFSNFDISLCLLNESEFNKCKSNLKILESGAHKCAVIASDVYPYNATIKHMENGLLINNKDPNALYDAIRLLIKNKNLRAELGENLHTFVKDNYSIDKINESRKQWIKS